MLPQKKSVQTKDFEFDAAEDDVSIFELFSWDLPGFERKQKHYLLNKHALCRLSARTRLF